MLEELLSEWPVRRAVVASTRGEVDDVAAMLRGRTDKIGGMHFLLIVPFLLVFSLSVIWAVSRTAPAPQPDKLIDTTFSAADFRAETRSLAEVSWWRNYRVWGGVLLVLCMLILIIFR